MGDTSTTLDSNFFTYPLIGVEQRNDGVNPTEILNYMFKKQFGIPNITPYGTYGTESSIPTTSINNCLLDKQYSQEIPQKFPTDIIEDSNFNNNDLYSSNSKRFISISKPYMVYYQDIVMLPVGDAAYHAGTYDSDNNIRFYLTQHAISPFYGNDPKINNNEKYYSKLIVSGANISNIEVTETILENRVVLDSDGFPTVDEENNEITTTVQVTRTRFVQTITGYTALGFGVKTDGSWLLDCDTGVLTFYDNVSPLTAIVNVTYPPRISFWRYEGLIGNKTIMNIADF